VERITPAFPGPGNPERVTIRLPRSGVSMCEHAALAATPMARLIGLLRTPTWGGQDGILLQPCASVHTWGMAFPIDVVALDRDHTVTALRAQLSPGKIALLGWRTRAVLELPAGKIEQTGIRIGDRLTIAVWNASRGPEAG